MKKRYMTSLFIISILFFTISFSFADFGINKLEIKELDNELIRDIEELEKELNENKKTNNNINNIREENEDNEDKIKKLKKTINILAEENNKLKNDINNMNNEVDELKNMISELLKKENNNEIVIKETNKEFPNQENLTATEIKYLKFNEPKNKEIKNQMFKQKDIYNSRISKAALKIITTEVKTIQIDISDLNITLRKMLQFPRKEIAYNEKIQIIISNYDKNGTLKTLTIKERGAKQ